VTTFAAYTNNFMMTTTLTLNTLWTQRCITANHVSGYAFM